MAEDGVSRQHGQSSANVLGLLAVAGALGSCLIVFSAASNSNSPRHDGALPPNDASNRAGSVDGKNAIADGPSAGTTLAFADGLQTGAPIRPAVAATQSAPAEAAQPVTGVSLFAHHCADCHGEKGGGDGIAARFLYPKPRDFRSEDFRLVSTTNGVPTVDDLVVVLTRGMPGSSMPAWPALSDNERRLLAEHVMKLRRNGVADGIREQFRQFGEEVDEDEVADIVAVRATPGDPIEVPELAESSPEAVARGRELYLSKGCASCHGNDGKGNTPQKMLDSKQRPVRARDLTLGYYKGRPDPAGVYRRILAGMPGSPMPASRQLKPQQVEDLTHFVLSLSDEKTRAATVLNREKITARRVTALPEGPLADAWNSAATVQLRVTPLWWRNDFEPLLSVQALHDGTTLAVRLSWSDATQNSHAMTSSDFEDAVAMELTTGPEPFLGMGSKQSAVDVWMWDADRQRNARLVDLHPNISVDQYPFEERLVSTAEYSRPGTAAKSTQPLSLPAKASGNPIVPDGSGGGSALQVGGPGSVTFRIPISVHVKATGQWKDGRWSVVLQRPLTVNDGEGVSLKPGQTASAAFAVWNGAHHDRNGQKLITIWQDLILE